MSTTVVAVVETGPWQYSFAATLGVGKLEGDEVGASVGDTVGEPRHRPVRSEQGSPLQNWVVSGNGATCAEINAVPGELIN